MIIQIDGKNDERLIKPTPYSFWIKKVIEKQNLVTLTLEK